MRFRLPIALLGFLLLVGSASSCGRTPDHQDALVPATTKGTLAPTTTSPPDMTSPPTTISPPDMTSPPTTTSPSLGGDLGDCKVMGPSDGGWEVLLRIPAVLGGGTYRIDYVLRDSSGVAVDSVFLALTLSEDDTVQYWDSPRSTATGVSSCEVVRIHQGSEACNAPDDCITST